MGEFGGIRLHFCEWCGHTGMGHAVPVADGNEKRVGAQGDVMRSTRCQVAVRTTLPDGSVIMTECGCTKSGPKRDLKPEPTVLLKPLEMCPVCGVEFALEDLPWCGENCKEIAVGKLKGTIVDLGDEPGQ